mmetsp:Transcript_44324/g.82318  ORF Transcript_44324/g.82318 Transcript_44324/m.82318 type:complete len:319 (-) Transcript_44324:127-1083(-)
MLSLSCSVTGQHSFADRRRSSLGKGKNLFDGNFSESALKFFSLGSSRRRSSHLMPNQSEASEETPGRVGTPFLILGTSADDKTCSPHVLSPPIMESLQGALPFAVSEDNFWLKFSLLRDGASLETMLESIRGAKSTIVAIETIDGEVFGSFTSVPWRRTRGYFGNGQSFLWRMKGKREELPGSVIDLALKESDVEIYSWSGENDVIQMCTRDRITVGGGTSNAGTSTANPCTVTDITQEEDAMSSGFGIAIENDLLAGTSSRCVTFNSPPLSSSHCDGSPFEILNLEVWAMSPCMSTEEAEKLESSLVFAEMNRIPVS